MNLPALQRTYAQASESQAFSGEVARTRLLFIGICGYIVSQAYTVPIAPIGPSWAVWPTLSDFAVGFIVIARLLARVGPVPSSPATPVFRSFAILSAICALSYLVHTVLIVNWTGGDGPSKAIIFGGFAIYRLVQFLIVLSAVRAVPFTPSRVQAISKVAFITFLTVCAGIIATYSSIVTPDQLAGHLPHSRVAGAWLNYIRVKGEGLGAIGYNHTYPALQVLALAALSLHLVGKERPNWGMTSVILGLGLLCCMLTGSRTGLLAMLLFCGIALSQVRGVSRYALATMFGLLSATVVALIPSEQSSGNSDKLTGDIFARQETLFQFYKADSLSGRDHIWKERIDHINEEPTRWIFGSGWGSSVDLVGGEAHNGALQVMEELGGLGLLLWGLFFARILYSLWKYEKGSRAVFWATLCLLESSLSQNTFYPIAWLGHFLGLYMLLVGVALRSEVAEQPIPAEGIPKRQRGLAS